MYIPYEWDVKWDKGGGRRYSYFVSRKLERVPGARAKTWMPAGPAKAANYRVHADDIASNGVAMCARHTHVGRIVLFVHDLLQVLHYDRRGEAGWCHCHH